MSQENQNSIKPVKKPGRPRKYKNPNERYTVYNKKRPHMRLNPKEKSIILWLRENPDELEVLYSKMEK